MDAGGRDVSGRDSARSSGPAPVGCARIPYGVPAPRRQTDSPDAPWVFCFGCDLAALGEGFEVLSDDGSGVIFGRTGR